MVEGARQGLLWHGEFSLMGLLLGLLARPALQVKVAGGFMGTLSRARARVESFVRPLIGILNDLALHVVSRCDPTRFPLSAAAVNSFLLRHAVTLLGEVGCFAGRSVSLVPHAVARRRSTRTRPLSHVCRSISTARC